jgi:hypothetical protein
MRNAKVKAKARNFRPKKNEKKAGIKGFCPRVRKRKQVRVLCRECKDPKKVCALSPDF